MEKIGILGGSFDPIHQGHMHLAQIAKEQLKLDGVIFIPAAISPFKAGEAATAYEHRFVMTAMAIAQCSVFSVSAIEALREGKSYTYDTLQLLKKIYPQAELYFITGSDSLLALEKWYRWQDMLQISYFVVVNRPGYAMEIKPEILQCPWAKEKIIILEADEIDISSTVLRKRLAGGGKECDKIPNRVMEYIAYHGLYRKNGEIERKEGRPDGGI